MKCSHCGHRIIGKSRRSAWRIFFAKICWTCFIDAEVQDAIFSMPEGLLRHLKPVKR